MKIRTSLAALSIPWILLSTVLLVSAAASVRADEMGAGTDPVLVAKIDALLADKTLQTGFQGLLIQSLKDHTTLYQRNADKVFLPASNNKLLTSAAAISLLGPTFLYTTHVDAASQPDKKGVLHSDLTLVGSGDPVLTSMDIADLAHAVKLAGVKRIEGNVIYNDMLFDAQRLGDGWTWDDEQDYYSAQVSALNLNENLVRVRVMPGKEENDPVVVIVTPTDKYMTIRSTAKTGPSNSASTISVMRVRGQNILVITGIVALNADDKTAPNVQLTVENPSEFALTLLREDLIKEGVSIGGKTLAPSSSSVNLAQHTSVPLTDMLKLLNKPSDNLIAECLLKTVGAVKKGQGTSGAGGTGSQASREFFFSIGMDVSRLNQADGSGLSRLNFVSPRCLVHLLAYLHEQPTFAAFYDSLPIAGVDGSLRNRMKSTAAAGNCHAKTGYVSRASSLSGYITTKDGEMLVFSILMNNHLTSNALPVSIQDKIAVMLAGYSRKSDGHAE